MLERAIAAIDAAHAADPARVEDRPAELVYAERVSEWIARLVPGAGDALRLAARAQHLERWVIPRRDYPEGRSGYFAWRRAVQRRQRERVEAILATVGVAPGTIARVGALVGKATRPDDVEGQALEDAACLVFFAHELAPFARAHPELDAHRLADIARKTCAKMSPAGRARVAEVPLPADLAPIVRAAAG